MAFENNFEMQTVFSKESVCVNCDKKKFKSKTPSKHYPMISLF